MPIAYPDILNLEVGPETWSWTERDSLLYALATGFARDPLDRRELDFVLGGERLKTSPAMLAAIGASALLSGRRLGIDSRGRVHGEETMVVHAPAPPSGAAVAMTRVVGCYDKGPSVGAAIISETTVHDAQSGALLATLSMTSFARFDGGFGGPRDAPERPAPPDRPPDLVVRDQTRPDQALLYRLVRDLNPLHVDPARAAAAGFTRPILHGLCLYGIVCRLILSHFCDYDPTALRSLAVRFAAPVYPGELLSFRFWRQGDELLFDARVEAREASVLRFGAAQLAPA
jgi:acyl dehydratase